MPTMYRWKFAVRTDDAQRGYLLLSGDMVKDPTDVLDWIGSVNGAGVEAWRRARLYEDKIGGIVRRVDPVSQGEVPE